MKMIQRENAGPFEQIKSAKDLGWAQSGVWVARVETIQSTPVAGSFQNPKGAINKLTPAELQRRYVQIAPMEWHSRFIPILAIPVREPGFLDLGEGNLIMTELGDAILNDAETFSVIQKEEYMEFYQVVGHRGRPKPVAPFVYSY